LTWIINDSNFEFIEKLGSGTFATVWKGIYSNRIVAIKVLKGDFDSKTGMEGQHKEKDIQDFKSEFQIMSAVQDPHVVFFFGACLTPRLCMVMEYMGRGTLHKVLNDQKFEVTWEHVISFCKDMVKGMIALHSHNPQIVHRDFKSLNLLVNEKYRVKVADFGLSRFNTETHEKTLVKMVGTMAYCAPESFENTKFTSKSDVYSIGITLWEIVNRCIKMQYERPYFDYPNLTLPIQIIMHVCNKGLRPTIPLSCPPMMADLIKECWDSDLGKRPSCPQLLERIHLIEADLKEKQIEWRKCINHHWQSGQIPPVESLTTKETEETKSV